MALDSREFRNALGRFATGVTVVSLQTPEGVHGMTANSFTSVSLEPPLILVCVDRRNRTHALIPETGRFGVSVLAEDQLAISNHYAGKRDESLNPRWRRDETESPVLDRALAWFDCRLHATYDGGDHSIFVGEVERMSYREGEPLLFFAGAYRRIGGAF